MNIIGYIRNDFTTKFGVPRQSGLVETKGEVYLVPPYNQVDAVRGLEEFSHIWLIWQFSHNERGRGRWSATVRPPRLGGNTRKGVFGTRSPYRPNPIGLSCVKLESISFEKEGPVLHILGADLVDGTPILDIKPYIPYADCKPEATGGFTERVTSQNLQVDIPQELEKKIPMHQRQLVRELLAQDPRPSYQEEPARIYGMAYGGMDIKFTVKEGWVTVTEVDK